MLGQAIVQFHLANNIDLKRQDFENISNMIGKVFGEDPVSMMLITNIFFK